MITPIKPGTDQESVWDYPRPPRIEAVDEDIRVIFQDTLIAQTRQAQRVLETSHPPVYYLPKMDIQMQYLLAVPGATFCEWKGSAEYYHVKVGNTLAKKAAWHYPNPRKNYKAIIDHIAFYAEAMDACYVGDEKVQPQQGNFYGGWITQKITGPFKGGKGTTGW